MLFPRTKARKPRLLLTKAYLVFSSHIKVMGGPCGFRILLTHKERIANNPGWGPRVWALRQPPVLWPLLFCSFWLWNVTRGKVFVVQVSKTDIFPWKERQAALRLMFVYLLRAIPGPAGLPAPCLETPALSGRDGWSSGYSLSVEGGGILLMTFLYF